MIAEQHFKAMSVEVTRSVELPAPTDEVVLSLTPLGKSAWLLGWQPIYLTGDGTESNSVFWQINDDVKSYWVMRELNMGTSVVSYVSFISDQLLVSLDYRVRTTGSNTSKLYIELRATGLNPQGNAFIDNHFRGDVMQQRMNDWSHRLVDYLE